MSRGQESTHSAKARDKQVSETQISAAPQQIQIRSHNLGLIRTHRRSWPTVLVQV